MPTDKQQALRILGGAELSGSICISGSKNAALPEMAAALLTKEQITLNNVPKVSDTAVMGEILSGLGGTTEGEGTLKIQMAGAAASEVTVGRSKTIRAPRSRSASATISVSVSVM